MTNEGLIVYLADAFIEYFDKNPRATSVSIGVNDSDWSGYCHCTECRTLMSEELSQHGDPDYSDLFFSFANGIAERAAQKHPDKYIGCLAYHACENPPSFAVHPMIIPYLTNDRGEWYDADFKQRDIEWILAWREVCPSVGVYSYDYGSQYIIPRIYPHIHEEFIKFLAENGIKGWYAEIYSRWYHDGPKAWLASQLMWNPDQDVDALLDDFCRGMFGAAADPMREYFDFCERTWMNQPGEGKWFRYYRRPEQLALYPEKVCREGERYLARAAEMADTDLARERVDIFAKGLRLTRLYSNAWHGPRDLPAVLESGGDLSPYIDASIKAVAGDREREELLNWMQDAGPIYRPAAGFPFSGPGSALAALMTQIKRHQDTGDARALEELSQGLADGAPGSAPDAAARYALALLAGTSSTSNLVTNGDFQATEGATGAQDGVGWDAEGAPPGWSIWQGSSSNGKCLWLTDDDNRFVRLQAVTNGVFLQNVKVTPGKRYTVACDFRGSIGEGVGGSLTMAWRDAEGNWTAEEARATVGIPNGEFGAWVRTGMTVIAPPTADRGVLMLASTRQIDDNSIDYDNVVMLEVP
jgi:hypothetical protein